MITSLFCLSQHFSVITSLIFIQSLGNYSFVSICWSVYCPTIHYHLFQSYWVVLLYQKTMVSLPFIFCWLNHIFLMIIQKDFFYLIAITYSKIIQSLQKWVKTCSKYSRHFLSFFWKSGYVMANRIEWCHMTYFTLNQWQIGDVSKNITWKVFKRIIFGNNSILSFQWGVIYPKVRN